MDSIAENLTISTYATCYYHVIYNNFVFQQDSALVHLGVQHSPAAAVQNSHTSP